MPAKSKAQQRAAGAALAARRAGRTPRSMGSMSTTELKKVAGTKHTGLPKRVK